MTNKKTRLQDTVERLIQRLGGAPNPHYGHCLETVAGILHISPYDTWVATRFEDVDRAKCLIGDGRLNRHSGKWNWHFAPNDLRDPQACARTIFKGLANILPNHDRYGPIQSANGTPYKPSAPFCVALSYRHTAAAGGIAEKRVVFQSSLPADIRPLLYAAASQNDSALFVPGQVGLEDLQNDSLGDNRGNKLPFHEIVSIRFTQNEEPTEDDSFDEFVDRCIDVALSKKGWDEKHRPALTLKDQDDPRALAYPRN